MNPNGPGFSPQVLLWVLVSQVFWLPLAAIDLHDRWVSHQRNITPPGRPLPESPLARAKPFSMDDLLGAAKPVQELAQQALRGTGSLANQALQGTGALAGQAVRSTGVILGAASSPAVSLLDRPFSMAIEQPAPSSTLRPPVVSGNRQAGPLGPQLHPHGLLGRAFTRAQLLGGGMGLADLQEGPMSALALAERSLAHSSPDPMATLPSSWREPMRQALQKLPGASGVIAPARMVYVPSAQVRQATVVPLALQSDGTVDILETPSNPAVLREIDSWSRQQQRPGKGALAPAVVHLQPLEEASVITPAAAAPSPAPQAAKPSAPRAGQVSSAPRAAAARSADLAPPVVNLAPIAPPAPAPAPEAASIPVAPAPVEAPVPAAAATEVSMLPVAPPPPLP